MQRRSNIKFNNVGVAGCASLLCLLVVTLMVPLVPPSAYADENAGSTVADNTHYETSTVGIELTPKTASATINPIADDGNSGKNKIDVGGKVTVTNSTGYDIYIGGTSSELVNSDKDATIGAVGVNNCGSDGGSACTYDNLPINKWGYAYIDDGGESQSNSTVYGALPATQRGKVIYDKHEGLAEGGSDTKEFTLSFAANIGTDKPSGTYSNDVTVSVISSPKEVTSSQYDFGVTYMQDLDKTKCSTANTTVPVGATAQLKDNRDEKSYWVTKMPDGHCWMTQNLDLDLPATAISSTSNQKIYNGSQMADTNASSWTPTKATQTTVSSSTVSKVATDSISWDQGLFVVKDPTSTTGCTSSSNANMNSGTGCDDYFKNVTGWTASDDPEFTSKHSGKTYDDSSRTYDAHYLVGNWYQWNAAAAGTGTASVLSTGSNDGNVTSEGNLKDAPSSICPRGWQLPKSGRASSEYNTWNRDGSFSNLLSSYGWTGKNNQSGQNSLNVSVLTSYSDILDMLSSTAYPPLFFVRSGYVNDNGYLANSGNSANYWSSTAYTTTAIAYRLYFTTNTTVNPSDANSRYLGYSVRCLTQ